MTHNSVFNQSNSLRDKSNVFDFQTATGSHSAIYGPLVDNWHFDLLVSHRQGHLQTLVAPSQRPPYFQNVTEKAKFSGEHDRYLSVWGNIVADLNNDGWLDVVSRTGELKPEADTPYLARRQPDVVAMNTGGQFRQVTLDEMGIVKSLNYSGRGGISADFDNDGDMDLFLSNNNDAGQLLINRTPKISDWLGLELIADTHTSGLDTAVTIEYQDGTRIRRHSNSRFSFLSYGDKRFLVPAAKPVREITIYWPDGSSSQHQNLPLNEYVKIEQSEELSIASLMNLGLEKIETTIGTKEEEVEAPLPPADSEFSLASAFTALPASEQDISTLFLTKELTLAHEPGSVAAWLYQLDSGALFNEPLFEKLATDPDAGLAFSRQLEYRPPGNTMLAYLPALFQNPDPEVREQAVNAISKWQIDATIPMVIPLLTDDSDAVKCAVNQMMIGLFEQTTTLSDHKWLALPDMINALGGSPAPCQLQALGASGHHKALRPLLSFLNHPDLITAMTARLALGQLRQPGGFLPMAEDLKMYALTDPDENSARLSLSSIVSLRKLASNQQLRELGEWLTSLSTEHVEMLLITFQRYNTPGLGLATLQEAVKEHLKPLRQAVLLPVNSYVHSPTLFF
ncbi:ASPIC/UnbV domain-containing protein [Veronia nyctiphanis]|uniref:ASPIC/UnbV domain-containing protein n=1 Tax=Veronia nyctiphanis TaxID=1278244 RepID=UPI00137629BA|nr:ASPIC/UnbV domain-containing protein [Veronia nyctiphanis]